MPRALRKTFLMLSLVVFSVFLSACFRSSSDKSSLTGFGDIEYVISGSNISIEVSNDVTNFDFTKVEVSDKASYKVYSDEAFENIVSEVTLNEGLNTYYLKVTAENGKNTSNYVIKITREILFDVSYSQGTGYEIVANGDYLLTRVKPGQSISFKVESKTGYTSSFIVKANESVLTPVQGVYTFSVSEDTIISVSDINKITYSITYPSDQLGYKLVNEDDSDFTLKTFEYGESFTFKLQVLQGYEGEATVRINGVVSDAVNGIYLVDMNTNITISVDGFYETTHNVLVPNNQIGYTLVKEDNTTFNSTQVYDMESVSFRVNVLEGYEGNVEILVNGTLLLSQDGVYKVENITENITIVVNGISKKVYTVDLPSEEDAFKVVNVDDTDFTLNSIEYGQSVSFKVNILEGYEGSLEVFNNGEELLPEDGVYSVPPVKENIVISIVANLQEIIYEINYGDQEAYTVEPVYTSEIVENIKHGDSFSFKLVAKEGYYEGDALVVTYNNGIVLEKDGDIYTLSNVKSHITFVIEGFEELISINYSDGPGYIFMTMPEYPESDLKASDEFKFWIDIDTEKYNFDELEVSYGGNIIEMDSDGLYTITNLSNDYEIIVGGVVIKKFTVGFIYDVVIFVDENDEEISNNISYGEDFIFRLRLKPGYEIDGDLEIYMGEMGEMGETLEPNDDGVYMIENITKDITLFAQGVFPISYNVNYPVDDRFNIEGELTALGGNDLEFTIYFDFKHSPAETGLVVRNNGEVLEVLQHESDGSVLVIVRDIVEDVNITIDEESIASGIVTLIVYNLSKDMRIYDELGQELSMISEFRYVETYKLRVDLGTGYLPSEEGLYFELYHPEHGYLLIEEDEDGYFNIPIVSAYTEIFLGGYDVTTYNIEFIYQDGLFNTGSNIKIIENIEYNTYFDLDDYLIKYIELLDENELGYAYFLDEENTVIILHEFTLNKDSTIYIRNKLENFTLNFGGQIINVYPELESYDIAKMVGEPRKEGEIFMGWSLSEDLSGEIFDTYRVVYMDFGFDVYLYPVFVPEFVVTFDFGGLKDNVNYHITQDFNYDDFDVDVVNPQLDGYVFLGWYPDDEFEDYKKVTLWDIMRFYEDAVVYAYLLPVYELTSDDEIYDNWILEIEDKIVYIKINQDNTVEYIKVYWYGSYANEYKLYKLNDGYIFKDEYSDYFYRVSLLDGVMLLQYEEFEKTDKILVELRTDDYGTRCQIINQGETATMPEDLFDDNREEEPIVYWYIDIENKILWDFEDVVSNHLVLYGFSREIDFITLSFDLDEETDPIADYVIDYFSYDKEEALPIAIKDGYIFLGWTGTELYDEMFLYIYEIVQYGYAYFGDTFTLTPIFTEEMDYSDDPILGTYMFEEEDQIITVELKANGALIVQMSEDDMMMDAVGYWKIETIEEEEVYVLYLYGEPAMVTFIPGETIEGDILSVEGMPFTRVI